MVIAESMRSGKRGCEGANIPSGPVAGLTGDLSFVLFAVLEIPMFVVFRIMESLIPYETYHCRLPFRVFTRSL